MESFPITNIKDTSTGTDANVPVSQLLSVEQESVTIKNIDFTKIIASKLIMVVSKSADIEGLQLLGEDGENAFKSHLMSLTGDKVSIKKSSIQNA